MCILINKIDQQRTYKLGTSEKCIQTSNAIWFDTNTKSQERTHHAKFLLKDESLLGSSGIVIA